MGRSPIRHLFLLTWLIIHHVHAQKPHQASASEIFNDIRKLSVLGNVMYLAAHPDDENTRFITWCAKERLLNTHYLSLTRGDGGQNLIGPELREELGLIRTQELLAARRVDGGTQSFTCANDFGYSKTAQETFRIWDRDRVLADVVWTVRMMRPDVIVCRFPPDSRGGHGHHTASAMLGIEAFRLAADPNAFPEQLKHVGIWQAKRIVTNTGRWWNAEVNADDRGVVAEDIGTFSPLLGSSVTEIAALSRSCHRSQGFGSTGTRGQQPEYFEHLAGDSASRSLFDAINLGWSRLNGTTDIEMLCRQIEEGFRVDAPHLSIPRLVELRRKLAVLPDRFWRTTKLAEVDQLIQHCAGLFIEANANTFALAPGDSLKLTLEVVNRSPVNMRLMAVQGRELSIHRTVDQPLANNHRNEFILNTVIPQDARTSHPFWLKEKGTLGMYRVDDPMLTHVPENAPAYTLEVQMEIAGEKLVYSVPVIHRWNDPVRGEKHRPFIVTPPASLSFGNALQVFTSTEEKELELIVRAGRDRLEGELAIHVPEGWTLSPFPRTISLKKKGDEQKVQLRLLPIGAAVSGTLRASLTVDGVTVDLNQRTIVHGHIPTQVHFPRAECRLVRIDLKGAGGRIGYLQGAGDGVAAALRTVGYRVDDLTEQDLAPEKLGQYEAIITGIRFLNVNDRAAYIMPNLLRYVKEGGTFIVQYNTSRTLETGTLVPYPLKLGRDRVTDEAADVTLLAPQHPALHRPNLISHADFEGWVQERGLYFPNEWSSEYTPLLRMNDPDETPKDGSLLVAPHGKGHFVYTGLSFFRQLPEGVPGAYRLLVNLLSLGR